MANSGEVCSHNRSRPAGVVAWVASEARCMSVLPPWPSTGVSTSSTPRAAKKARTTASNRARSRSVSMLAVGRQSFVILLLKTVQATLNQRDLHVDCGGGDRPTPCPLHRLPYQSSKSFRPEKRTHRCAYQSSALHLH